MHDFRTLAIVVMPAAIGLYVLCFALVLVAWWRG